MSGMGNEDRTTAIERALGMSMGLGILELLEGDLVGASRMLRCNDKDLEPVVGALRTAPPVGDPSRGDLQRAIEPHDPDAADRMARGDQVLAAQR